MPRRLDGRDRGGAPRQVKPAKGPWALFLEAMSSTFLGFGRMRQPVGALLWWCWDLRCARFTGAPAPRSRPPRPPDNVVSNVRDVKAESDGTVRIQLR